MIPLLVVVVAAAGLALAGWAGWFVARDRAVATIQLKWGAALEVLLVLQALWAGGLLVMGRGDVSGWLFWGYVVTQLLILPLAGLWATAERTRWSSAVLLVAGLTVAFLEFRLWQIWAWA